MENTWMFCPNLTVVQQLWSFTNNIITVLTQATDFNLELKFMFDDVSDVGAASATI